MKNIFSYLVIIIGILIALLSIFIDVIGLGKSGFQVAQIFGLEIGILVILFGIALFIFQKKIEEDTVSIWLNLRDKMYNLPSFFWVVIGILPSFIPFLVAPIFFNPDLHSHFPERYLPRLLPLGNDIYLLIEAIKTWNESNQTTAFVFTPLVIFLFSPLLLLSNPQSYYFIVTATLVSYLILSLIAILISDSRNHSSIVFITAISIFSYGMQFELIQGQSHTIALMLCVWAIYIFHKQPHFRMFAYLLFCIAVQLKFYPALFIVLFVDDWRDWKNNLKRFGVLGLANFLALFMLGFSYFYSFYNKMFGSLQGGEVSVANHSIHSFGSFLVFSGLFEGSTLNWIQKHLGSIENTLYIFFLICFLAVLANAYLKNIRGINLDLLLVCVIGAMVTPSVNHDYTLPMLTIPFALSLSDWHTRNYPWAKIVTIILIIAASFTYSLTLFPIKYRPVYIQNSLPMIFIILTLVTLQNLLQKKLPLQV